MGILFVSLSHVNFNKTRFIVFYITSQAPNILCVFNFISCFTKLGLTGICRVFIFNDRFRFMVFNASFNNISVISWSSVLLMEETSVPGENHGPVANHWHTLSHTVVSSTPRHERDSNSQHYWWSASIQLPYNHGLDGPYF